MQHAQDRDRVSSEKDDVFEVAEAEDKEKGKGKLMKEESKESVIGWREGEQETLEEKIEEGEGDELPPIEVLEDDSVDEEIAGYP